MNKLYTYLALIFFICLCICKNTSAQHYQFKNIGINNGLPSSLVYKIHEDKKGYIWFLTEKGVARFDGKQYTYFGIKDGFTEAGSYQIIEDKRGDLWFLSTSFKLFVFRNGVFTPIKTNILFAWINLGLDGEILALGRHNFPFIYAINNKLSVVTKLAIIQGWNSDFWEYKKDHFLVAGLNGIHINIAGKSKLIVGMKSKRSRILPKIFKIDSHLYFTTDAGLYQFDKQQLKGVLVYQTDKNEIFYVSKDEATENIWLSTTNGLLEFENEQRMATPLKIYFLNNKVYSAQKLNDNSFWISTYSKGVFVANLAAKHINATEGIDDEKIMNVKKLGGDCYFFNYGNYYKYNGHQIKKYIFPDRQLKDENNRLLMFANSMDDSVVFMCGYNNSYLLNNKGVKKFSYNKDSCLVVDNKLEKGIALLSLKGLSINTFNNVITPFYKGNYIMEAFRAKNIIIDNLNPLYFEKDTVYVNSNLGLLKIFLSDKKVAYNTILPQIEVSQVLKYKQKFIISTLINGLFIIDGLNIINKYTLNGLNTNYIKRLAIHENKLWLCTNKGLARLDLDNYEQITTFTDADYLINNEVNDVTFINDTVFVATSGGLSFFAKNAGFKPSHPYIYLEKFQVNNKDTTIQSNYEFSYTQNNFSLNFSSPSYRSGAQNVYRFIVVKDNTSFDTTYTKSDLIQLSALAPGSYQFVVSAKNIDGFWSKTPYTFHILINPPIWETLIFRLVVIGIFILILAFIIVSAFWRYKREQDFQRRIAESELRSLRLYMNPHFIFNSLASLQSFILTQNTALANNYITRFSKLIRSIMGFSVKGEISLKEEVQLIKSYLELEQIRFENVFSFQITYNTEMDLPNIIIPSLITQPFVENAVKHGITGLKDRQGKIEVEYVMRNEKLYCIIQDNGLGVDINKKKDSDYISSGIRFTEERIKLIVNNPNEQVIKMQNLDELNQQGTRIEVLIPILNKNEV